MEGVYNSFTCKPKIEDGFRLNTNYSRNKDLPDQLYLLVSTQVKVAPRSL